MDFKLDLTVVVEGVDPLVETAGCRAPSNDELIRLLRVRGVFLHLLEIGSGEVHTFIVVAIYHA